MTFFESNDSSAFEADGIRMEIGEPDLIILPVPDKRGSANTHLQINILSSSTLG